MQIVSGQITKAYAVDANCPWCKMSKLRYDIEFAALALEGKQTIDSSYIVKGICVHCFTVCDELPKMDFICAKCQELTPYTEDGSESEQGLFERMFAPGFGEFYRKLTTEGMKVGKRYCLSCIYKIWRGFSANPELLRLEIEKPKPDYPLNT